MSNSLSQQLEEERKMRATAVQTLTIAENSNTDLKKRLTAEEQARKNADAALEGAERQAESQRKLAREANDQLAASKEQLAALKSNWRRLKGLEIKLKKPGFKEKKPRPKLRRKEMKPSSMVMMSAWLRPRMPQKSLPYVVPTALRLGKKPSIELGLTLLPS